MNTKKYIILHHGIQIGEVRAASLENANDHAREVFGDDVYCKIESDNDGEVK